MTLRYHPQLCLVPHYDNCSILIGQKDCQPLHGDISQDQREVTLQGFKDKKFSVLVATDVAARGLDIPSVELVVQLRPARDVETFIHRTGRTGRAGKEGTSIVFFTYREASQLKRIEKHAGITFKRIGTPQASDLVSAASEKVNVAFF